MKGRASGRTHTWSLLSLSLLSLRSTPCSLSLPTRLQQPGLCLDPRGSHACGGAHGLGLPPSRAAEGQQLSSLAASTTDRRRDYRRLDCSSAPSTITRSYCYSLLLLATRCYLLLAAAACCCWTMPHVPIDRGQAGPRPTPPPTPAAPAAAPCPSSSSGAAGPPAPPRASSEPPAGRW